MALDLGTLAGELEMNPTKWDQGFDRAVATLQDFERKSIPQARAAGKKVGDSVGEGIGEGAKDGIEKETPGIRDAGEKAGEEAGDGMLTKGKLAAAAAAAAVGAAFVEGLDVGAANDKLAASLGAGDKRAVELARVSSDLYSNAWGESIDQVNEAIGFTVRNIGGMRKASEEDLGAIASRVLDVVTAFDQDLAMTTAAAGQMVRTGMAKDIGEALDIITVGLQGPANKADDLLETYNEYGTQFRKLGLDGKDTILLLSQGLKAGARDADIVADSMKEFSIRTLEALEQTDSKGRVTLTELGNAFDNVGLRGKAMYEAQEDLAAGGDRARRTFERMVDGLRRIDDPATRARTAVSLFGTQAEDMGDALYALDLDKPTKEIDKVRGASQRMSDTLNDNAKTKITTFKRSVQMNLVDFLGNNVIPAIEDFADSPAAKTMWDAVLAAKDDLAPLGKSILPAMATSLEAVGTAVEFAAPFVKTIFDSFNSLPKDLQAALVIGGTAAALSKKFTGSANPLTGVAGGVLGKAAPVPVFVTNMGGGMGLPGLGGPPGTGGPGGAPGKLGPVGRAASFASKAFWPVAAMTTATIALKDLYDWNHEGDTDLGRMGGGKIGDWARGIANAGDVASDTKARLDNVRNAAEKAERQLGDTKTAGQVLAEELFALDKIDPNVDITAPGFDQLLYNARQFRGLLDGLDGDTVETYIKVTRLKNDTGEGTTGQPPNRSGPASAGGGVYSSAQWAYLGEGGPEIVRPLADDLAMRRQATAGVEIDYDRLAQTLLLARPLHGDVYVSGDPTEFKRQMLADERATNRSGRRRVGVS